MEKIVWKGIEYDYGVMNDMDRIFLVKDNKAYYVCGGGEVREWKYPPDCIDVMAYPITQQDIDYYGPRSK